MRTVVVIIFLAFFFGKVTFGQENMSIHHETAFNRLGWSYELGLGRSFKKQVVQLGIKWYEPDFVFEDNWPGIYFKHSWCMQEWGKWGLQSKLEVDLFFETKANIQFWLSNPMFGGEIFRKLGERWQVNMEVCAGPVLNWARNTNTHETNDYQYFNLQAGIGVVYHFGTGPANQ